jgi:hypothetical protein
MAKVAKLGKRAAAGTVTCPRCGMPGAHIVGRSESLPVLYLRCEDCGKMSIAPGTADPPTDSVIRARFRFDESVDSSQFCVGR